MGLFSSSRTTQQHDTEVTNYNQQGIDGPAFAGVGGNVSIETVDGEIVGDALNFGRAALDTVTVTTRDAVDAANRATDSTVIVARDAMHYQQQGLSESLDFGAGVVERFSTGTREVVDALGSSQERALTTIASAQRSDTAQTLQHLTKYMVYGVVAVGAVIIVVAMRKK